MTAVKKMLTSCDNGKRSIIQRSRKWVLQNLRDHMTVFRCVCVSCVQRNAVILTSGVGPTPAGRARGAIARISTFSTTVPHCASSAVSRPHCRVYLLSASDPSPAAIRQQQLLPRDGGVCKTRSSADADNRLDAFSGQSRSTNMVPFHM